MKDDNKTKEQLLNELVEMRQRIAELEASETERKRTEEALRESEERFRNIYEESPIGIELYDPDGRLLHANKACLDMFGVSDIGEIKGFQLFKDPNVADEEKDRLRDGETVRYEVPFDFEKVRKLDLYRTTKSGIIYLDVLITPLGLKGKGSPSGYLVQVQDITERKRAEEELRRYRDHLEELVEERTSELKKEIAERRQAEEALRESEERLKLALEAATDGLYDWSMQTGEVYFSPRYYTMLGYEPYEMSASYDTWINLLHPDDREHAVNIVNEHIEKKRDSHEIEFRLRTKSGGWRWILSRGRVVERDVSGRPIRMVGTHVDLTERKRAEEEIRQRTAQLEALRVVGLKLTTQLNLGVLLRSIISQAVELLGGTAGGLYLYQQDLDALEWVVAVGPTAVPVGGVLHRGEGLSGKVWKTGEPLIVEDYQRWEGRASIYEGLPSAAVVAVPIRWGQEFLGTLHVEDVPSHIFSPADAELLSLLAPQAAIAIKNARLYEQARQDSETKATLLQEVNHRVKNNLTAITGLLYAERRRSGMEDQPAYQSLLDDLTSRLQGLSTVHGLLSASEWTPLPLDELAWQVIQAALQMSPRDKYISVDVTPSPVRVTPKQANSLALVINELATNTVKYALVKRPKAHISVRIALEEDAVLFEFHDDGPGYPEEALRLERHNVGLYLIQTMVRDDLRGELSLHNDHGAVTTVRFKKDLSGF